MTPTNIPQAVLSALLYLALLALVTLALVVASEADADSRAVPVPPVVMSPRPPSLPLRLSFVDEHGAPIDLVVLSPDGTYRCVGLPTPAELSGLDQDFLPVWFALCGRRAP